MFGNLRNLVTTGVVLGLLVIPAFSATVIPSTTYNFDASDTGTTAAFTNGADAVLSNTTLTGTAASHLGAGGTDGVLGPFGNSAVGLVQNNQVVKMTITSPGPSFNAITLSFDLWVMSSWDGNGWVYTNPVSGNQETYTPDQFQVALTSPSGSSCTGSALCTTFAQDYPGVTQEYGGSGSPGTTGAMVTRPFSGSAYFSNAGFGSQYTSNGYALYRIDLGTLNLGSSVNSLTVYFRGLFSGTLQLGTDESWAISRVVYSASAPDVGGGEVPEPSTVVLGGLGLALLALAKMRNRKA